MKNGLDATFSGEIFRKDHPMIIASNRHLASIKPVRLAYYAAGLVAGTILARDPADGLFKKFADVPANPDSACVLFENIDYYDAAETPLARGVFAGEVFAAKLVGAAPAIAALGGKIFQDATGIQTLKF